jgi:hypothetical protein
MPPVCPECKEANWLSKPSMAESFFEKGYKPVVCENCGWEGEADDLEQED